MIEIINTPPMHPALAAFASMEKSEQRDFVYAEHEAFDSDLEQSAGTWRWGERRRLVVQVKATGDLYAITYRNHHEEGFVDAKPPVRVQRVEKTVTVVEYVPVEGGSK